MTTTYILKEDPRGNWILMTRDGQDYAVPTDPANSDYQAYLRHLAGEDEAQSL